MPYVKNRVEITMISEIMVRVILLVCFVLMEYMSPFFRVIHSEELWLYKNPKTVDYVPSYYVWIIATLCPLSIIFSLNVGRQTRSKINFWQGFLGYSLTFCINGIVTDVIKLSYGRPRPDFFFRCFPDATSSDAAALVSDVLLPSDCPGDHRTVIEGLKSFPSGHSSFSFASLGFTSLYLFGKLKVFSKRPSGGPNSIHLLVASTPLLVALLIAVSRSCDYHHHWQDIVVGVMIGLSLAWLGYHQYFPRLTHPSSHLSYEEMRQLQATTDGTRKNRLMSDSSTKIEECDSGGRGDLDDIKIM